MRKSLTLLLPALLAYCYSYAQATSAEIPMILPPSPTASQITRYAAVSPSMSTGDANTHITLHNYATKNLSMPLTLNYNSGGLKIDEVASHVGTGWTLDAGGLISRTVYGLPDENASFITAPSGFPAVSGSPLTTYISAVIGGGDTQSDLFNFSFGGYSGKFIIQGGNIIKLEQNNLIITGSIGTGFIIYTPDGTKYTFSKVESNKSVSSGNPSYRVTLPSQAVGI